MFKLSYKIHQLKKQWSAMFLQQKIFKKWNQKDLISKYDWKNQLNLFFEISEHKKCAHRNKIMRLLMKDLLSSRWMKNSEKQTSNKSSFTLYKIRSTMMKAARKMHVHYHDEHFQNFHSVELIYVYWRKKHIDYNYENILKKFSTKRFSINLYYWFHVLNIWSNKKMKKSVDVICLISMKQSVLKTNDDVFDFESSDARRLIQSNKASNQQIDSNDFETNSMSLINFWFHQNDFFDDYCCSVENFFIEEYDQYQKKNFVTTENKSIVF